MAFSKTCLIVWKCIEIWRSISISFRPQAITSFTAKKSAGHRTWNEITFAFIFYQYFIFGPSISIVKYHTHFEYTSCDLLYFAACPTHCLDWRRRNCLSSLDLPAVPPKTYWADSSSVWLQFENRLFYFDGLGAIVAEKFEHGLIVDTQHFRQVKKKSWLVTDPHLSFTSKDPAICRASRKHKDSSRIRTQPYEAWGVLFKEKANSWLLNSLVQMSVTGSNSPSPTMHEQMINHGDFIPSLWKTAFFGLFRYQNTWPVEFLARIRRQGCSSAERGGISPPIL